MAGGVESPPSLPPTPNLEGAALLQTLLSSWDQRAAGKQGLLQLCILTLHNVCHSSHGNWAALEYGYRIIGDQERADLCMGGVCRQVALGASAHALSLRLLVLPKVGGNRFENGESSW